jgi:hypothetical protein
VSALILIGTLVKFELTTLQAVGLTSQDFRDHVASEIHSSTSSDSALCSYVVTETSEIAQSDLTAFMARCRNSFGQAVDALERKHSRLVPAVAQQLRRIEPDWPAASDSKAAAAAVMPPRAGTSPLVVCFGDPRLFRLFPPPPFSPVRSRPG